MARSRGYDVFLSFAEEDKEWVLRLARALRDRDVEPWIYIEQIRGGADITVRLERAARECRCAAFVLSRHWERSRWTRAELSHWWALGDSETPAPALIPIMLELIKPPIPLGGLAYIDFTASDRFIDNVERFCASVAEAPARAPDQRDTRSTSAPPPSQPAARAMAPRAAASSRSPGIYARTLGALLAVCCGVLGAAWLSAEAKPTAVPSSSTSPIVEERETAPTLASNPTGGALEGVAPLAAAPAFVPKPDEPVVMVASAEPLRAIGVRGGVVAGAPNVKPAALRTITLQLAVDDREQCKSISAYPFELGQGVSARVRDDCTVIFRDVPESFKARTIDAELGKCCRVLGTIDASRGFASARVHRKEEGCLRCKEGREECTCRKLCDPLYSGCLETR